MNGLARIYGDPAGGGGFSPHRGFAPPPPPPQALIPPSAVAIAPPPAPPPIPAYRPPPVQAPPPPPPAPAYNPYAFAQGVINSPLAMQLFAQNRQAPPDTGGPPFPWQRPAWQREGYPSEAAYQADLMRYG